MTQSAWHIYKVRFAAESPIHIGWHDLGLIQRTRYYVPARSLWGVLVAHLAPALGLGPDVMYGEAKKQVRDCLRVTNFFPTDQGSLDAWLPRYTPDDKVDSEAGLHFGELTAAQFEQRFVYSQTSVALQADCLAAEEGALHETEFLSNVGRDRSRLSFVGHVLVREKPNATWVAQALERCMVGADRRYGWGRLRRTAFDPAESLFGCFELNGEGKDGPTVRPLKGSFHLPAHLRTAGMEADFTGDVEVVSGRDWELSLGPGQSIIPPVLCWAPGSAHAVDKATSFEIEPTGLWRSATVA